MDKLYIASCAKSGTHYTSEFLRQLGLDVRHEFPGRDGIVTWYISHVPPQFPCQYEFDVDNAICLHQTREPIKTISSLMLLDRDSWKYVMRAWNQDIFATPILKRCMQYYYEWHKALENCTFTYPLEQITELLDILDLFDIKYDKTKVDKALNIGKQGATLIPKPNIFWEDLFNEDEELANKIHGMSKKYEYCIC